MTKTVKVSYSFYKKYFRDCKTGEYDPKRKTIEIEVPERPQFPKEWIIDGQWRHTPEGVRVCTFGSGYSESYRVLVLYRDNPKGRIREKSMDINPSTHARQDVFASVSEFAKMPNIENVILNRQKEGRECI